MRTTSRKRTARKGTGGKKKKDILGKGEHYCPRDEHYRTHEIACQVHQLDTPLKCASDCPYLKKVLESCVGLQEQ